jgi:hypothetical protein
MKNTNFEIQKTNIKTIQNTTKNISPATYDRNTLNTMYDINHISKQKRNNISFSNEMSLFAIQPSDKLLRHNPAATSEWDNSSYSYLKGESQVSSVVDQSTHELIKLFFNSRPKNINNKSSIFRHKSILKTYVGIPRIKTSINRARITIYKYDRKTVYNMNMLNKSYTLWPNKKRTKQDENLKLIRASHTASNKLVTTNMKKGYNYLASTNNRINNTNSTFTAKRFKTYNYSPLAYEKKAVKPFSSSAKTLSPISDSKEESNNNREKPNVRKVLSLSLDRNSPIPTLQNNLYIIRLSGKKSSFSGAPNLEISMPKSNKGKRNHNYIYGNGDPKILRKSVEKIKNKVKISKSIILDPFAIKGNRNKRTRKSVFFSGKFVRQETKYTDSNNNPIILTNVIKGYNKSNKTMVFGKHPFHNKVSGKFKTVNKVRVFTPSSYPMNNIRYWYLPVSKKSLTNKRKTNIKAIDTRRPTPKRNERKWSFASSPTFNRRKITGYKKRISRGKQRKLKKKVQNGKKRILLNILRNKTFHLVLSTLKITSINKPSILLFKSIENYSLSFIAKIKSLKLFLSHFSNMPSSYSAPDLLVWNKIRNSLFISKNREIISSGKKNIVKKKKKTKTILLVTVWKKIRNSSNPLSTLFEAKVSKKKEIIFPVTGKKNIFLSKYKTKTNMFNKLIIPTLRVGKFLGKLYKRILPYTSYCAMIWVSYMKSNYLYLSRLIYILKKRYQKIISLNIVDLKYLYLDSYIMASAITTKLKDRKKRVLRVLKRALGAIKKPYFKIHFYNRKKTLEQANTNLLFMDQNFMTTYSSSKNILLNKHLYKKPSNYKPRLLLYHLKHKVVTGVRLQGSGRLTRRLTASRSISKFKYMGSLQNLESSRQGISTNMLRGYMKSNLQYTNMNSYNRNGAFGVKVSVSSY